MPKSLSFPFAIGVTGGVTATSSSAERIAAEIVNVVTTARRERVMRPEYGVGIRDFLFQPNSDDTRGQMKAAIDTGIRTTVTAAVLQKVEVRPGDDPASVIVDVAFTLAEEVRGEVYLVSVASNGTATEVR